MRLELRPFLLPKWSAENQENEYEMSILQSR